MNFSSNSSVKPLLSVNSKHIYYVNDAKNTFKLIDTGTGLPEHMTIQGLSDEKVTITESTLIHFKLGNDLTHKVYK